MTFTRVVTLCGSARFEDQFHEWNKRLTLAGFVVLDLAVYPSYMGGIKDWYTDAHKITLDLAHLAKIELSDAILVINPDGYIGDSTKREIEWARHRRKEVWALSRIFQTVCREYVVQSPLDDAFDFFVVER